MLPLLADDMRGVRAAAVEGIARLRVALAERGLARPRRRQRRGRRRSDQGQDPRADRASRARRLDRRDRLGWARPRRRRGRGRAPAHGRSDGLRARARVDRAAWQPPPTRPSSRSSTASRSPSREALYRLIGALAGEVDQRLINLLLEGLEDTLETVAAAACDALRAGRWPLGDGPAVSQLWSRRARSASTRPRLWPRSSARLARARKGGGHDELLLLIGGSWPHVGPARP